MLLQVIDVDLGLIVALEIEVNRGTRQPRIDIHRLDVQRAPVVARGGLQITPRVRDRREHVEGVAAAGGDLQGVLGGRARILRAAGIEVDLRLQGQRTHFAALDLLGELGARHGAIVLA